MPLLILYFNYCYVIIVTGGKKMNFKEKYDNIIDYIEKNIKLSKKEIIKGVVNEFAMGNKMLLINAFQFIADISMSEYIKRRQLLYILKYKISHKCSIEQAAFDYGYSNAQNYIRDFKSCFGVTPKQMTDKALKNEKPLYIETIVMRKDVDDELTNTLKKDEKKVFGLTSSQLINIRKAMEFQALFGWTDEEADFAYQLSERINLDLEDVYYFIDDYLSHEDWVKKRYKEVKIENLAEICIRLGISVCAGLEIALDIDSSSFSREFKEYKDIPKEFWELMSNLDDLNVLFDFEQFPSLALSIIVKMQEEDISLSEVKDVFEFIDVYGGDIDERIHDYKYGYDDDFEDELDMRTLLDYFEVDSTYTNEFLGIDPEGKYKKDFLDNDEDE